MFVIEKFNLTQKHKMKTFTLMINLIMKKFPDDKKKV